MEFTSDKMILLLTIVFPLLFMIAGIILDAGVCLIIPLLAWVGVAIVMLYFPTTSEE